LGTYSELGKKYLTAIYYVTMLHLNESLNWEIFKAAGSCRREGITFRTVCMRAGFFSAKSLDRYYVLNESYQ
jgi:hypothetical protein